MTKFDEKVISVFNAIKDGSYREDFVIPVYDKGDMVAVLRPVTRKDLAERSELLAGLLAEWRDKSSAWYPSAFKVTREGTKKWLEEGVLGAEDRLLFLVETLDGAPIGHMGLFRGEADNFIRGREGVLKGAMTLSLNAMLKWAFDDLGMRELYLRVFLDNRRAIGLYRRCGFREIGRIPMRRVEGPDGIRWVESSGDAEHAEHAERFFSVMMIKNPNLRSG